LCMFGKPKKIEPSIAPKPPELPEKPPEPVEVKKDSANKKLKRKNPLRIERESGGKPASGASI